MSFGWRERLQRAKRRLMEQMGLTEEDWDHIWDNIGDYCHESDKQVKLVCGAHCDIDAEVDKLDDEDFDEMCRDIINKIMKKLGYIKVKERKKKQKKKKKSKEKEETSKSSEQEEEVPEERAEPQTVEVSNDS